LIATVDALVDRIRGGMGSLNREAASRKEEYIFSFTGSYYILPLYHGTNG
jgi:hypothetical protein